MAVITISRQFGAGGRTLGVMVAKKLGYQFLDDAVIQELAKRARVSPSTIKSIERSAGTLFSKLISSTLSKGYMERLTGEKIGYMDEDIYVEKLWEVITEFAKKDNLVILGRGGQYILQEMENAYHIELIADKKDRIDFMKRHYKFTDSQALQAVRDGEKRRKNLYAKLGKKDFDRPCIYHLVINMSKIPLDKGLKLICDLVK
ncbi:MAG: cytidylate kinase-like family protein [Thermodesulfobacteriota bacterium]|nr:cytidylate kinase-like family protein [Thermodesulfobacteriota bacterium]